MDEGWLIVDDTLRIPERELSVRFVTGGGPGGQHVNKSATKVILSFDIAGSPSLTERQRARLLQKLAGRIDGGGVLSVQVHETRSQKQNRDIATGRLLLLLTAALYEPPPRRRTKPSRAVREHRLREKQQRAEKKKRRRWRYDGS